MGFTFCAIGSMGFKSNLTSGEIVEQLVYASRLSPKRNIDFMSSDLKDKISWKDRGSGHLSIRCKEGVGKGTRESKPTILIRNDVGKLFLNALLYPGIKTNNQKNAVVAIFHTSGEMDKNDTVVAQTWLIRTKNEVDRDKLAEIIQDYAPSAYWSRILSSQDSWAIKCNPAYIRSHARSFGYCKRVAFKGY